MFVRAGNPVFSNRMGNTVYNKLCDEYIAEHLAKKIVIVDISNYLALFSNHVSRYDIPQPTKKALFRFIVEYVLTCHEACYIDPIDMANELTILLKTDKILPSNVQASVVLYIFKSLGGLWTTMLEYIHCEISLVVGEDNVDVSTFLPFEWFNISETDVKLSLIN